MSRKEILRSGLFLLLLLALILSAWAVLDRKLACHYTKAVHGFFNEEPESMDVIFVGSSHAYCSANPMALWDETGLSSYVLSTQSQPLQASYHYLQQCFTTQSPKVVVLEMYMASQSLEAATDAVLRDAIDPLPWRHGKAALIRELVPAGERASYYFNLAKYHGRWSELSEQNFDFSYLRGRDEYRGFVCFTPSRPANCFRLSYEGVTPRALSAEGREQLLRIRELVESNGAELMLFIAPYEGADKDLEMLSGMHAFAEEQGLELVDFNLVYDELGFDGDKDFFDPNHLNAYGADKATRYMGRRIMERYDIEAVSDARHEHWRAEFERLGMEEFR